MPRSTFEKESEELDFQSIIEAGSLDTWLDHVSMFHYEFRLHITPEGYSTRVVDTAGVGMIDTRLDKTAFESHKSGPTGEGSIILGVNIERIQDVLGLVSSDQLVEVTFDDESRMLHLNAGEVSQSVALIDPETIQQEPDMPDLDVPTEVVLPGRSLDTATKAADLVSKTITIGYYDGDSENRQEGLFFSAEGDIDDTLVEPDEQSVESCGETETMLSVDYLKTLTKQVPKDGDVRITVGKEHPTQFDFTAEDQRGEETIESTVIIAPRIPSNL